MSDSLSRPVHPFLAVAVVATVTGLGCGSSSSPGGMANPVVDLTMQDSHCSGMPPQPVDPAACQVPASDAGAGGDDGGADGGGSVVPQFGDTLFNDEGDDDDCKYHLKYSIKPAPNRYVTFTAALTKLAAPGGPAIGAALDSQHGFSVEAYLDRDHTHVEMNPTPATGVSETPPGSGIYTITPVWLDVSGRWVVRFHLFNTCYDTLPTSPHAHVAFFVDVP